jgi:hypothetical protein
MNIEIEMPIVFLCSGELVPWHLAHSFILGNLNVGGVDRLIIEPPPAQSSATRYRGSSCCYREFYPSQSIHLKNSIP